MMHKDQIAFQPVMLFPLRKIHLWLSWVFGLISGIAFSYCSDSFVSLMRGAALSPVSIVGLGAVMILPFLLSAFAVIIDHPGLLIPLAFCKAFLFAACAASVDHSFGDSGWLIRALLMFSDLCSLPVLFWLWTSCFTRGKDHYFRIITISFVLIILIGSVDFLIIAPFLASVI